MRLELEKIFTFTDRDKVKPDQKGWFADNLKDLNDLIESDNYTSSNFGKVYIDIRNNLYPFKNGSNNINFSFFYPYEESIDSYRTFNEDEMKSLVGNIVVDKQNYWPHLISDFEFLNENSGMPSTPILLVGSAWKSADELLEGYLLNDKPCGIRT
jgi:hypothetical protein